MFIPIVIVLCLLMGPVYAQNDVPQTAIAESDAIAVQDREARLLVALQSDTPEQAVAGATEQVMMLIEEAQAYADADPDRFYQEVEALVNPMIDFKRFARNVMGPAYRQASAEQRQRFADSFKWSLVKTYALALVDFKDGQTEVLKPRRPHRDPNEANVAQEVTVANRTYVAVYRVKRNKAGVWRVQNITIEGINVGAAYKTQFKTALRDPAYDGDLDKVIDAWGGFVAASANNT